MPEAMLPTPSAELRALLDQSASLHKHLCPRQVLGVRMGLLAGRILNLPLPQTDRKRLFVFMETDGCTADGVSVSTGCWIGHRTLRILHFGKVAATFVDRQDGSAFRITPHPQSREKAVEMLPQMTSWEAMLLAYQTLPDDRLLVARPVVFQGDLEAMISRPSARATCDLCGEEILNDLQVERDGQTLCRACAGEAYYSPLDMT